MVKEKTGRISSDGRGRHWRERKRLERTSTRQSCFVSILSSTKFCRCPAPKSISRTSRMPVSRSSPLSSASVLIYTFNASTCSILAICGLKPHSCYQHIAANHLHSFPPQASIGETMIAITTVARVYFSAPCEMGASSPFSFSRRTPLCDNTPHRVATTKPI